MSFLSFLKTPTWTIRKIRVFLYEAFRIDLLGEFSKTKDPLRHYRIDGVHFRRTYHGTRSQDEVHMAPKRKGKGVYGMTGVPTVMSFQQKTT